MKIRDVLVDFFSLFFPVYCYGCRNGLVRGEDILCTNCVAELPRLDFHESDDNPLTNRFAGRLPIKHGWALLKFQKAGIVQNLMHELKYNNHPEIGTKLGKLMAFTALDGFENEFDLIVPVPLHKSRMRARGYNQSSMIAKGIAEVFSIPHDDSIMVRLAATKTQTKKSKVDRWENVRSAFQVKRPELVSGKRILLVDDVITTGATLEACAEKLLAVGAQEISVACLADVA